MTILFIMFLIIYSKGTGSKQKDKKRRRLINTDELTDTDLQIFSQSYIDTKYNQHQQVPYNPNRQRPEPPIGGEFS